VLGTGAVAWHATAPLLAAAALLGVAYGACMTSGLRLVETLSRPETRAGLAGLYYVLTYVGFGTPLGLAIAARKMPPTVALCGVAALALAAAAALRAPPLSRSSPQGGRVKVGE
jgi:MFS family permease